MKRFEIGWRCFFHGHNKQDFQSVFLFYLTVEQFLRVRMCPTSQLKFLRHFRNDETNMKLSNHKYSSLNQKIKKKQKSNTFRELFRF